MTKREFHSWLISKGCTINPLQSNTTASTVVVKHSRSNLSAYLDLPLDDRPMKAYAACKIAIILNIEIPPFCVDQTDLVNEIKKKHYPNFG